ncbi:MULTISPECIES: S8 family peptidase [Capnocytophaga]|uniref:S8 family peptidase n=1 Tax=Capnocytophaga TaxID=1016 RepID=UPI00027C416B|nr:MULTISPECIES: S8 family peptidase [Capnocytophaga]EJU29746.1 peptidase, S8/S53 family [Capnocytophaga sp. CM59]
MNIIKPISMGAFASLLVACGGTSKIASLPIETLEGKNIPTQVENPSKDELKTWPHRDLLTTGYPGISLAEAYKALKGRKAQTVIVGVVDSGVDINHEDLKSIIWTNPKEIPNNGIDDDKNGYVDDVHGWNFLGEINQDNLEYVRILKKGDTSDPDYKRAEEKYDKEFKDANEKIELYSQIKERITQSDALIQKHLGKKEYTEEDLDKIDASSLQLLGAVRGMKYLLSNGVSVKETLEELSEGIKHYEDRLKYGLNKEFNPRKVLNDNPDDITDKIYGNNNVIGPTAEGALHGTHVAGIIAAVRHNNIGIDGVADHVRIMPVRTVPDGDEYDKDVALALRYAIDNGAKVINTSFGKEFSPHKEWVYDALKYAAEKDVLIVNAAGNDTKNVDVQLTFPDDNINGKEFTDTMITIGALNYEYNENLVASFSNYGKNNVDLFSPGVQIYATVPENKYKFLDGTSMAAPEVAGVAALIRAYFPKLKAREVKQILMESGLTPTVKEVLVGGRGEEGEAKRMLFSELSKSGKIVNAYNAIILAAQRSK